MKSRLAQIYPILYLDATHISTRQKGRVGRMAAQVVLGIDLEGRRDVLGLWVREGAWSASVLNRSQGGSSVRLITRIVHRDDAHELLDLAKEGMYHAATKTNTDCR